jgi:hypothetical protein
MLHREHPAPRVSEDVDAVETEPGPDDVHLLDERVREPQRVVVGAIGPSTAELVVADHGVAVGSDRIEDRQSCARRARPTVHDQQR